ncbi:carbohydrate ABC transporter permease [Thermobaculum terrenum]|uniref:carbohydrate ABC transporter permease n=1 Tax=Thermobaculum terrenum TaxID=166501 RepID=UPI001F496679|nr:carbohydrate ABC transporter permease [Thermobaculum terrenum]
MSSAILAAGALFILVPFFWMVSTALKPASQTYIFPPVWIPRPPRFQNFREVLDLVPFLTYARNTFIIVASVLVGTLLSCSFSAYGFARLRAPGRDLIFLGLLATMMLPSTVTLVPTYLGFNKLGWINTFKPLIVPAFFGNAYFVFLLRQFYRTIPKDLEDAAKIDGASYYRIWWNIMLPLTTPALATVALFTFVWTYNDFFGPLIYLTDDTKWTIAVALSQFQGSPRIGPQMHLLMAATTLAIVPPVALFLLAQRYFVQGIVMTGIKG